jgi:hypothetical protein
MLASAAKGSKIAVDWDHISLPCPGLLSCGFLWLHWIADRS